VRLVKLRTVHCLLACTFLTSSCGVTSALKSEPEKMADEYWKKTLTKCGDHYFTLNSVHDMGTGISEYQGVSFAIEDFGMSDANRLNGYEWSGRAVADCRATRYSNAESGGTWTDWQTGCVWKLPLKVSMWKFKGKWFYQTLDFINAPRTGVALVADSYQPKKLACESIKQ
jgi:hypothetical protein